MPRRLFPEDKVHPAIQGVLGSHQSDIIDEVSQAIDVHPVVVVGMSQNPFPKKARKLLDAQGVTYHYLEYGSYLNSWRRRNALKMWTGWPTFPMIFVRGTFIGGFNDLKALVDKGDLATMLA
jgi:monothiol glutaredoxin